MDKHVFFKFIYKAVAPVAERGLREEKACSNFYDNFEVMNL